VLHEILGVLHHDHLVLPARRHPLVVPSADASLVTGYLNGWFGHGS
jgi:hypothetical protein